MCGRTALNFTEDELRAELARANVNINQVINQPAWRQTYNVAPTYNQPVIRQVGERRDSSHNTRPTSDSPAEAPEAPISTNSFGKPGDLIVQTMRWGLIPFWTKRQPDFASVLRTINCRDDSLLDKKGMWNAMKGRKRCVIPVMGYYEWLKKSPKEKIPYFTKRADGKIMLLAGLWDTVQYEGTDERIYSYTIITTNPAKSISFLHDRMPVILDPDSVEFKRWLDPNEGWSMDLANILKPYEGPLLCYPVKKEVGKVGENSPLFIVPVDSAENKSNIANFFSKPPSPTKPKLTKPRLKEAIEEHAGGDISAAPRSPGKRKIEDVEEIDIKVDEGTPPPKVKALEDEFAGKSPVRTPQRKPTKRTPQSPGKSPVKKSPVKKEAGLKITNFFSAK